ncbi:MAG: hypothetical protein MPN21_19075 [Thermoanaerobaculia bacterium]|nr:hypothetical protein [Thermoanaerobaculia bacterium]
MEETELHPDDNFSIGGLDVLLAFDGPSLLRKLKEVDADFEQTLYRYQPPGEAIPEIKVFVPHK